MSGKLHANGRFISLYEREQHGLHGHYSRETLCGYLFKRTDRYPFADNEEDVTCQLCQVIINKHETKSYINT